MKIGSYMLSVSLGLFLFCRINHAADTATAAVPDRAALRYGYDVPGQVHNNPSLFVRSIISSTRSDLPAIEGTPRSRLTYTICNIEPGNEVSKRPPAKLYFQWPDAGIGTEIQGEIPFEGCVLTRRTITGDVKQQASNILYTYKLRTIAAQDIWVMSWDLPWTQPSRYWEHLLEVFRDGTRAINAPEEEYSIQIIKKRPEDGGAYQTLRWRPGTQMYLALPKLTHEQVGAYIASLDHYKKAGLRYAIQPAPEFTQDFTSDSEILESFENRNVLRIEMSADREKVNQMNTIHITVPTSTIDLIQLPSILRDRSSKRPIYKAQYVIPGS